MPYDTSKIALFHPELQAPLRPPTPDWPIAAMCAELSRLAYLRFETDPAAQNALGAALAAFGCTAPATFVDARSDTQAFATTRGNDAFIVFRGTQSGNLLDFVTDIKAVLVDWDGAAKVHQGFKLAFKSVEDALLSWRQSCGATHATITGHSLGAALATLLAARLPNDTLVTFGSPRVGNAAFAARFNAARVARYVDCCDVVTTQPLNLLGYSHIGGEHYIDRHGQLPAAPSGLDIELDRDAARVGYLLQTFSTEKVGSRDLADHAPANYIRALLGPPPL